LALFSGKENRVKHDIKVDFILAFLGPIGKHEISENSNKINSFV